MSELDKDPDVTALNLLLTSRGTTPAAHALISAMRGMVDYVEAVGTGRAKHNEKKTARRLMEVYRRV